MRSKKKRLLPEQATKLLKASALRYYRKHSDTFTQDRLRRKIRQVKYRLRKVQTITEGPHGLLDFKEDSAQEMGWFRKFFTDFHHEARLHRDATLQEIRKLSAEVDVFRARILATPKEAVEQLLSAKQLPLASHDIPDGVCVVGDDGSLNVSDDGGLLFMHEQVHRSTTDPTSPLHTTASLHVAQFLSQLMQSASASSAEVTPQSEHESRWVREYGGLEDEEIGDTIRSSTVGFSPGDSDGDASSASQEDIDESFQQAVDSEPEGRPQSLPRTTIRTAWQRVSSLVPWTRSSVSGEEDALDGGSLPSSTALAEEDDLPCDVPYGSPFLLDDPDKVLKLVDEPDEQRVLYEIDQVLLRSRFLRRESATNTGRLGVDEHPAMSSHREVER